MTNLRWLWLLLPLYSLGCASTAPAPLAAPSLPVVANTTHDESADYAKELQQTIAQIAARESVKPADTPAADVEAAISMDIPSHKSVRSAITLFSTEMKPDIQTYLTRSARYRKLIEKALHEYDLPNALAYLPVIESGYSPTMTSRSGAHGIWQFMPETAREYGLRVDWWVDERADPERSTHAAAAYLKDLYRQFNDWPLVLAAYNAGPGRIRRALDATGAKSFWELLEQSAVPKETRGYVPTFFATVAIASDPASYGFSLDKPQQFDMKSVELEGPLSLKYLAEVAKVEEKQLRELNPALHHGVLPPGKSSVRLPSKSAEAVVARASTLRSEDPSLSVCSFTLREGDSIKRLARALGTTPAELLAMNQLASSEGVGSGDSVYLPVRARELGALLQHADDEQFYYAVRKGDTLFSIAKRHHLTIAELLDLNDLGHSHKIHSGERLRVSIPHTVTAGGM